MLKNYLMARNPLIGTITLQISKKRIEELLEISKEKIDQQKNMTSDSFETKDKTENTRGNPKVFVKNRKQNCRSYKCVGVRRNEQTAKTDTKIFCL